QSAFGACRCSCLATSRMWATRRLAIGRPSWVRWISGSAPRLPTRMTLLTLAIWFSLLAVSSPRPSRSRWRSKGRRRSATHPQGRGRGGWGRKTFLPREECASAQEKKVTQPPLRQDDRGAAVLWTDQAIKRPPRRVPDSLQGENMVDKRAK